MIPAGRVTPDYVASFDLLLVVCPASAAFVDLNGSIFPVPSEFKMWNM
jgi:hypothetical protein